MPFIDAQGHPLDAIHLVQRPLDSRYFQLAKPIAYLDPTTGRRFDAPAHDLAAPPIEGNRTDIASVPRVFWSLIAAYGRQSPASIVHDAQGSLAHELPPGERLEFMAHADAAFRRGLRGQKVPLFRAWLMWSFVALGRYWLFGRRRFLLMLLVMATTIVVGYAAILGAVVGRPIALWWLAVPLAGLAATWWEWRLVLFTALSLFLLAPFVALHVLSILPLRLVELLARELVDRPFLDHEPGPVITPTIARGD